MFSKMINDNYRWTVGGGYDNHVSIFLHKFCIISEELLEIMSLDCPPNYEVPFYKNYCNLLLSVFYLPCRNLRELRHLVSYKGSNLYNTTCNLGLFHKLSYKMGWLQLLFCLGRGGSGGSTCPCGVGEGGRGKHIVYGCYECRTVHGGSGEIQYMVVLNELPSPFSPLRTVSGTAPTRCESTT